MYLPISELPVSIQKALSEVQYHKKDIEVQVKEEFYPRPPSAEGRKGFLAACRLDDSNAYDITWGSYGGQNAFVKTIDDVDGSYEIPNNMAFILGYSSGGPGYPALAHVVIGPNNINKSLLPMKTDVSEREEMILSIFKRLKASYRKQYLSEKKVTQQEIDSLIERGYLKKNKVGISITTQGKNSAGKGYYGF